MSPRTQQRFVVARGRAPPQAAAAAGGAHAQPLVFVTAPTFRPWTPPFARIGARSARGPLPPLARMAGGLLMSEDGAGLLFDEAHEAPAAVGGHSDQWFAERCVFCSDCKTTINSQHHKRGSRCHGCRRWWHAGCAVPAEGAARGARFFHSAECEQAYEQLAAVAAAGEQALPLPRRSWLPWQQAPGEEAASWRLLDLAAVRSAYRDAQRRGTLFEAAARAAAALEAQAQAAQGSEGGAAAAPVGGATPAPAWRRVAPSRLDDFLIVAELLRGTLGDTPRELLEDSFAVITRSSGGAPTCVATLNVYGRDHARVQGLATPQAVQRQGHATRLLGRLEDVLGGAGLGQLVLIMDQQEEAPKPGVVPAAELEGWARRLGFRPVSAEQAMLWRRELPEYHKSLTAGCALLAKPLAAPGARRGWWW
ncbi:hypothetical protein HT031_000743 [Scenedesmus sp. PABB004]|nr:hypothetical protein HT031_000743 [Scenedesmus sp. PABB004]